VVVAAGAVIELAFGVAAIVQHRNGVRPSE